MRPLTQSGKPQHHLRPESGFSLIELLIVVAIILIIAAIAVPNLLHAKIAANEAAAAEVLRTITTAAVTYNSTYGNGYPATLANLGGPSAGPSTCDLSVLMDTVIANPPSQKSGFKFAYTAVGAPVTAIPGCSAAGSNAYLVTAAHIRIRHRNPQFLQRRARHHSLRHHRRHRRQPKRLRSPARPAIVTANRAHPDSQRIAWCLHPSSLPES